jgi:hypothetical protein
VSLLSLIAMKDCPDPRLIARGGNERYGVQARLHVRTLGKPNLRHGPAYRAGISEGTLKYDAFTPSG